MSWSDIAFGTTKPVSYRPVNPLSDTQLPAPKVIQQPSVSTVNDWLTQVWYLCDPLRHNDNAVCILGIVQEIADEELNGFAAMIAKGKELFSEFSTLLGALIREESALSGAALAKCVREVFDVKPVVFLPSPAPLKHNPLLAPAPVTQGVLM